MRTIFIIFSLLFSTVALSQDQVHWDFKVENEVFTAEATIAEGWHLYSQRISNEIGPIPTSFHFNENEMIKLIGDTHEPESLKEYDENFEGELNFFKDKVEFTQKLKINGADKMEGFVTYMICNATMCLPPTDKKFTITLEN